MMKRKRCIDSMLDTIEIAYDKGYLSNKPDPKLAKEISLKIESNCILEIPRSCFIRDEGIEYIADTVINDEHEKLKSNKSSLDSSLEAISLASMAYGLLVVVPDSIQGGTAFVAGECIKILEQPSVVLIVYDPWSRYSTYKELGVVIRDLKKDDVEYYLTNLYVDPLRNPYEMPVDYPWLCLCINLEDALHIVKFSGGSIDAIVDGNRVIL